LRWFNFAFDWVSIILNSAFNLKLEEVKDVLGGILSLDNALLGYK